MENKKKIIMVALSVLVCMMAVGYAVLAQQLNITGTTSIDSTWKVEITNITEKAIVGDATSKVTPSYTSTTANFSVGLIQPGDSITYDIEVTNSGTLDAVLESINVTTDETEAIKYTTSGVQRGDKLTKNGGKNTLTIKVEYDSSITSQPSVTASDITVTLNYQQDLGQVPVTYDAYSIGDTITFAGSNWYVIKNSSSEEDYVTLMKEQVLTHDELGENYAITSSGGIEYDTMVYYWSDTCHYEGYTYGTDTYDTHDTSGCAGHTDYAGSKVKEYLEGTYINTLGSDKLKEVDGYQIRLITLEELQTNLGISTETTGSYYEYDAENTPSWVYQNFGDSNNGVYGYWTMTPHPDYSSNVWRVNHDGDLYSNSVHDDYGVRPVINLLKSNI